MTYDTFTRPIDPLVARNPFRGRQARPTDIASFNHVRSLLPEPVLPSRPGWVEMYWRAWELAWSNLRRPKAASGFVANFIDTAFNDNTFMWDSAFMVQFGWYARRGFDFMGTLDNFYAKQHNDGYICREINTHDGTDFFPPFDPVGTGPNVLAWAEWRYYRHTGDDSRLADVFWPLMALHRWFRAHRTWPGGLYWTTGLGSGMDNQTRIPDSMLHHQHWTWVDASMQAALNAWVLEQVANLLEEPELAQELSQERTFLTQEINNRLWNEDTGFYQDVSPAGAFSPVKTIGAYWALLAKDLVPSDRRGPFLRHLRDADAFKRPHRVPSQSADSEGYDAATGAYWRGGVWPPTNYMVLKGLRTVGQNLLAHQIGTNHLENVFQVFAHTDTFWENYAPEKAEPGEPAKPNFVGWSGLPPIAVLLEDVIGISVDWPLRRVTWDRRLEEAGTYGVRNFPLGEEGVLEMVGDEAQIEVTSNVSFTLTIEDEGGSLQTAIPAGTTTIDLK